MQRLQVIISLLIWALIGAAAWYAGYRSFEYIVRSLQASHPAISLSQFPWGKAYSPEERSKLIRTFAYTRTALCRDSLLLTELQKSNAYNRWDTDEILFNLYDIFFLRSPEDSVGKMALLFDLRKLSTYSSYSDSQVERFFRNCLLQVVVIKDGELERILASVWRERHQSQVAFVGTLLTIVYVVLFLLFLHNRMFGRKRLMSILRFDDVPKGQPGQ
jgi:hypothetical protein